jgi:hypothetical protein
MIEFITPYTHHSELQAIQRYRWFIFYSSLLHTSVLSLLHSPLVVSWQRIHNNLTVTVANYEVFFAQPNFFLAISSIILPTANSGDPVNYVLPLPTPELNSILILAAWDPRYIASGRTHRKHRFLYYCALIHCCRDVFTAPLLSNTRGANHRKHRSSVVARFRFSGNVFTEPLLSNKLFRLSGVMPLYLLKTRP